MTVIRQARESDIPQVEVLLVEAHLPYHDVREYLRDLFVADEAGSVLGVGGLEPWAPRAGLLRSFAVAPHCRGMGIGESILARVMERAEELGMAFLYVLSNGAEPFFAKRGFTALDHDHAPDGVSRQLSGPCGEAATLMRWRADPEERARKLFNSGYFCAEAVLMAVAEQCGVESPLIPGIATGLCSGMARTSGSCGAVTGAVLALNLVHGRCDPSGSTDANYSAVQDMLREFEEEFGSCNCTGLLGVDLGTEAGREAFRQQRLRSRCAEFTGKAARLATKLAGPSS